MIEDEDTELIRAINSGEAHRFSELVARHEARLYNFGLRICRNPEDAQDLVQDTFINAFRYLEGFRHESRFRNWLYKVATTVCIKIRRRSKFAPDMELSLEDVMPRDGAPMPDEVPEWAKAPLDSVLNRELGERIHVALQDLPPKYRLVIALRDMEGFSTQETAEILGITETNVKVRLHRARMFLRESLRGYFHDGTTP